jgi:hypothetical protein
LPSLPAGTSHGVKAWEVKNKNPRKERPEQRTHPEHSLFGNSLQHTNRFSINPLNHPAQNLIGNLGCGFIALVILQVSVAHRCLSALVSKQPADLTEAVAS